MNRHILAATKAAKNLRLDIKKIDKDGLFIEISDGNKSEYFIQQVPPLNSTITKRICKDKEYSYELLKNVINMPKTKGYIDPKIQQNYTEYIHYKSNKEVIEDMEKEFSYPFVVKRNAGSQGRNVFICKNKEELENAINKIFTKTYLNYDYALVAQDKIDIKQEFRAVILNRKIEVLYLKDNSEAKFTGNLSPLHFENAKAVHITDNNVINKLQEFINPIFTKLDLQYGGLDIVIDNKDQLWLIEPNSHPFFDLFIRDNGDSAIVKLYEKMLMSLFDI